VGERGGKLLFVGEEPVSVSVLHTIILISCHVENDLDFRKEGLLFLGQDSKSA
jgi:hypothetical protein